MGSFPTRRSSDLINGLGSAQIGAASSTTTGYDGTSASVSGGFTDALNQIGRASCRERVYVCAGASLTKKKGSYRENAGTKNVGFRTFANLQGGSGVDTFALTGAATFNLKGGAGLDVVNFGGCGSRGTIALRAGSVAVCGPGRAQIGAASSTTTGYAGTSASVSGGFTDALN